MIDRTTGGRRAAAGEGSSPHGPPAPLGPSGWEPSRYRTVRVALDAESEVLRATPVEPGAGAELARVRLLGRDVASRASRLRLQARLERAAALRHPCLVVPRALDWEDGRAVVASAWVEGPTLGAWAREVRRPRRAVLRVFHGLCEALAAAHAAGLVHGGLGAGKVIVDAGGVPRVLGLGVRKDLTLAAARYAAPGLVLEGRLRADERGDDPGLDVASLGLLLFEMLTGRNPWEHVPDVAALRAAIAAGEPPRPSSLRFRVGRELDAVVHAATARQRGARYASLAELVADVERLLAGRRVRALPPRRWYLFRTLPPGA